MVSRPQNHVTKELGQRFLEKGSPCPDLTEPLLAWLEAHYPARCLGPRETVEDHLRYAGKVELIATLRAQLTERLDTDEHLSPDLLQAVSASE